MYFAAERWNYFAVVSRNKTGENGFAVKPSQDGEEKIFENEKLEYLVLSIWYLAKGSGATCRRVP
jgi:hypothetical protein